MTVLVESINLYPTLCFIYYSWMYMSLLWRNKGESRQLPEGLVGGRRHEQSRPWRRWSETTSRQNLAACTLSASCSASLSETTSVNSDQNKINTITSVRESSGRETGDSCPVYQSGLSGLGLRVGESFSQPQPVQSQRFQTVLLRAYSLLKLSQLTTDGYIFRIRIVINRLGQMTGNQSCRYSKNTNYTWLKHIFKLKTKQIPAWAYCMSTEKQGINDCIKNTHERKISCVL